MKPFPSGGRRAMLCALALAIVVALAVPAAAVADTGYGYGDVDIFLGNSGGVANAANVMILVDNSSNWARNSQGWTDLTTGTTINQGQAEAEAIKTAIQFVEQQGQDINIGLAMLSPYYVNGASTGGGYIRFAARNMAYSVANSSGTTTYPNAIALDNILTHLYNYTNGGGGQDEECCGMSHKDESAAFYELYKYFSGLTPFTGVYPQNPWVDLSGNLTGYGVTAADQGMTSGFALTTAGGNYQSPISSSAPCANNYIIYIANNTYGQTGSTENVYQSNVVPPLTALPATSTLKNGDTWLDEWTHFLYQSGAVVPAGNNNGAIVTYVLDAYSSQNDAGYSASLKAAAIQGGGRYYQVGNTQAVYNAIINILAQIEAINSTFASASLPINATNRAQNENQVFIPMFRPDSKDQPRWMGNLKEYQLVDLNGAIQLGDATGAAAVNTNTGFPMPCALSFWTTDSTDATNYPNAYWNYGESINSSGYWNTTVESNFSKSTCPSPTFGVYTDDQDGPIVEKGGVAEVIRKGDNPPTTSSTPTWSPAARNVLTLQGTSGTTLVPFNQANSALPSSLVNWVLGYDVQDENGNGKTAETRPSVHGDEIHSRPLPVDYGSGAVMVFYGSNDGTLRAVDSSTGKELWAFIAPEFYTPAPAVYPPTGSVTSPPTGLERLMWSAMTDSNGNQISPMVKYFDMNTTNMTPAPKPKDYYFDGSVGLYEGATSSNGVPSSVWIYPTMRRGGRMIYALDVTSASTPKFLWKFGCPSLTSDTGCGVLSSTSGITAPDAAAIGETWSMPAVAASVLGYSSPVVIVGGGYDAEENTAGLPCEDANTNVPGCTGEKGAGIFVLDAQTGQELHFFSTAIPTVAGTGRAVVGDVALIAISTPGVVDHAYAADTGGNVYRIDFDSNMSNWAIHVVARTTGAGRKFLFAPALLAAPNNQVYVALGSGDREHPLAAEYPYMQATQSTPINQRFYVFKDSLASPGSGADSPLNLDDPTKMYDFTSPTVCSTQGVLPTSTMSGWFMDLDQNGPGEQTVTSALIAAGMVTFSTNRPAPPSSTIGTCSPLLGYAYGYWVNLFNASGGISAAGASCGGTRSVPFVGGGLPPSPSIATVPVGGSVVQVILGAAQLSGGASTAISPQQIGPAIVPARKLIYWKSSGTD